MVEPNFFCGLKFRRETKREGKNTHSRDAEHKDTVKGASNTWIFPALLNFFQYTDRYVPRYNSLAR